MEFSMWSAGRDMWSCVANYLLVLLVLVVYREERVSSNEKFLKKLHSKNWSIFFFYSAVTFQPSG